MSGYGPLAAHYDALTRNVDYRARAAYFDALIREHAHCEVCTVLDLACGTGSLTLELAARGYETIGVDGSLEMLSAAAAKLGGCEGPAPLFLCQDMRELDLYGTVDACVCALDSLNHLPDEAALRKAVKRVGLFLHPGGVFAFDLNTPYKHRELLAGRSYVYDLDEVFCAWSGEAEADSNERDKIRIALDFFTPQGDGLYSRSGEQFTETVFPHATVCAALEAAGLEFLALFHEDSREPPHDRSERVVYLARKPA